MVSETQGNEAEQSSRFDSLVDLAVLPEPRKIALFGVLFHIAQK